MPLSLAALRADDDLRRHEFPAVTAGIPLAHAGVCPLPRRVAEASVAYARACTLADQEQALAPALVAGTRQLAARLLGAQPDEVSLVGPTSLALSFIAAGLPSRRGDNIVVYQHDYPSNVYPWMALAARGIEVRFLNVRELGKLRVVDVQGQVDENTRLVALASCHYLTGWRLNVDALGKWLRSRRILFCLDAIQTLGAFPLSVAHVDFLAADAHKWLLGPCAAGILYVRKELQSWLQPVVHGWHNLKCPDFLTQDTLEFRTDARRFEAGTHNFLGLAGLQEALRLALEIGVDQIAAELLRQRARLVTALQAKGYVVLQPEPPPENTGGLVSFHRPDTDLAALHAALAEAGVTASLRKLPGGERVLRFSPHYYLDDAELDRAAELL
jgi:cysteine desulfurase / selenocysteine lyase